MEQNYQADVVVVGAGTAGSFFAWRIAQRGYRVLVFEKQALADLGKPIEIIHMEQVRYAEFGIPLPEPPELIHLERLSNTYSPDLKVKVPIHGDFYVIHMPLFIQRLQRYAQDAGVVFYENHTIEGILLENDQLVGITGRSQEETFSATAKLIVDASGLQAAVRTLLPDGFGVENAPVPPDKCLYVCLELRRDIPEGFPTGSNGYMFHKAFWNKSYGDDVVLGIGQPHSFNYAWEKHREWREEYFGDPGKVVGRRQGVIPFTRTPFSLVGCGFMVIGDAANQNKPFSGEGISSGFTAVKLAVDVADRALQKVKTDLVSLWEYNLGYMRGQGAKFAASLAQLPAAAELEREDVNYLFRKGIIFSSEDFEELNRDYELQMNTRKLLHIAFTLIWGVLTGQFKAQSLVRFLKASLLAGKIKQHYLQYPEDPSGFNEWVNKAKALWQD